MNRPFKYVLEGNVNSFILSKRIAESYDVVINQDFNPDFVELFGLDSYKMGFIDGLIVGGLIIGSAYAIFRFVKKGIKGDNL